jgi:hypothetical protein
MERLPEQVIDPAAPFAAHAGEIIMPTHNDNADRWGGPGSSHEDRTRPKPDPVVKDADAPDHLSPRSQLSAGGERDVHHGHSPEAKHATQATSEEKRHERDNRN